MNSLYFADLLRPIFRSILLLQIRMRCPTNGRLDSRSRNGSDRRIALYLCMIIVSFLLLPGANNAAAQGALTNGWTHTGTISPAGDSDSWTFSASTGDRIVLRVGEITQTGSFSPRIRLSTPNAVQQAVASGTVAAEISVTATNTGTFTVIVDDVVSTTATGTYRLTLAKSPGAISVAPGDEGGPLTNGVMHTGTLDVGDLDVWTLTATNGDTLTLAIGETVAGSSLTPALWLYGPDGKLLDSGSGTAAAQVSFRATNSGSFIVVAGDFSSAFAGSGTYRLTLARTGSPVVVSTGDEGGPLANGATYNGVIEVGDLDVWTLTANSGDNLTIAMGESVSGSTLTPVVWLYGPDGRLLNSGYGTAAIQVSFRATNSGTFLVVAGDFSTGFGGSGAYRLTLAKTGSSFLVSAGDEGGPLTNGVMHTGNIYVGDVDMWSFTANAGESIDLRIGEAVNGSPLTPAVWLYGPDGRLLDSGYGTVAAPASFRATNSGTFLVVVGDFSTGYVGSGAYRLTLARTGDPIVILPGDEGGPLANGVMHSGTIDLGDLDTWSFTATNGDSITVGMGEIVNASTLTPVLWLYGPDGRLLDSGYGTAAIQVGFRATNSGTFTVVAGDFSSAYAGSGTYRLTLAKAPGEVFTTPGDEGGPLNGTNTYDGTLDVGDLDVFYFTACVGDTLTVRMDELVTGSSLTPYLRLYGRNGVLIRSAFGTATAQVSAPATNNGTFTLVVGDFSNGFVGSGKYHLTVNGLSAGLKLCVPSIAGANVSLTEIGGQAGGTFVVYTHTNVTDLSTLWLPIRTNQFDQFGVSTVTNAFNSAEPQRYFRLWVP